MFLKAGFCLTVAFLAAAQTETAPPKVVAGIPANYDEALAGNYTLPDPLVLLDGKPVRDAGTWYTQRRPEIVHLFEENQFGRSPGRPAGMTFDVFDKGTPAFGGKAIRKQVTVYFSPDKSGPKMDLLVYVPAKARTPAPLLLNIGFSGNSVIVDDPGVKEGEVWNKEKKKVPASQGFAFGKIDVVPLLDAGFGFATVYYGDIEPDFEGGLQYGVRALYLKPGQTQPAADEWGAIAAWGWGLSRALDYLETDRAVDSSRVALFGASRLGKTVLWAAARDTRFAAVIACCSGEGGAALSRRNYGETVAHLTAPGRFSYQFCANYAKFGSQVDKLPVDANMLVALIAPRPLLLQTGDKDFWSDPKGEFLAEKAAGPVYTLLGKQGLETDQWPPAGTPILHTLAYYMHAGGHGTLPGDWPRFLAFLQTNLQSSDDARMNQIQVLGSHNSYKRAIDPLLLSILHKQAGKEIDGLEYSHLPLAEQLDMGLRALEIDVVYDPQGGLYAHPKGLQLEKQNGGHASEYDPEGLMAKPGFKVLHVPDIDFRADAYTFQQELGKLKAWSDAHPNHLPIPVTMNAKDDGIHKPGFVQPLPFDEAALEAWDAEILEGLGRGRIITPDDVRGEYPTLESAVLAQAWPKLSQSRGKFFFVLDETGKKMETYIAGHPSLKGRVMFVNVDEGRPEAAIRIVNEPKEDWAYIQYLVRSGYFVRTRADADTAEARKNDYSRLRAALISGAQVISTDYYVPDPKLKTGFCVKLPGAGPGRWNSLLLPAERPLPALE